MLHPHIHEEFNHFAKALFATFLGLLMALGMESWHQERHRRHTAEEALQSVLRELSDNRKNLHSLAQDNTETPKKMELLIGLLESLQDARTAHRPWHPKDPNMSLSLEHSAGSLKCCSWTMALADQSVERFPKAQAEALANVYNQIGRYQAFLDQPVDYSLLSAMGTPGSWEGLLQRLNRLSDRELEHLVESCRLLKVRMDFTRQWAEGIETFIVKKLPVPAE